MSPKQDAYRGFVTESRRSDSMCPTDAQLLQYARPGTADECELVVGLDFGTSSSKVVIQAPDLPGHPSYAVDFGGLSCLPHLLPSRLWVSDGSCSLVPCNGARMIKDLKLGLMLSEEQSTSSPTLHEVAATCYLALLLRASRRWFLHTRHGLVGHFRKLRWGLNLGVPSPCVEDNEQNRVFKRVGKAAWWLSTLPETDITYKKASTELKNVTEDPDYWETDEEFACDFDIIPEIAAGAMGYALSSHRREGVHVMIDVGALTVDACSFFLDTHEESNRFRLLIADVQPLGTAKLFSDQIASIRDLYEKHYSLLWDKHDPMAPAIHDLRRFHVPLEDIDKAANDARTGLKSSLRGMFQKVIWDTKREKKPDDPVWRKGGRLPVLLIGGGSKDTFFRSAVDELSAWLSKYSGNNGIAFPSAPLSSTFTHSERQQDQHLFLAVACGLSHRALDIGNIYPPGATPNAEPPRRPNLDIRYPGKWVT